MSSIIFFIFFLYFLFLLKTTSSEPYVKPVETFKQEHHLRNIRVKKAEEPFEIQKDNTIAAGEASQPSNTEVGIITS